MFGYINANRKELSEENKQIYQNYYCGLCQVLKEEGGRKSQMLLNYDMSFLILLLTGLFELEEKEYTFTCPLHPMKKKTAIVNEATVYAAKMNILLSYYNFEDDWKDDRNLGKKALTKVFSKDYEEIVKEYPRQAAVISRAMQKLAQAEKNKETNIDVVAGMTGEMLAEIFAWKEKDVFNEELRCMGFYMGKFIYLMDAYEDIEKDAKNRSYNPFLVNQQKQGKDFEIFVRLTLTSMMTESAKAFERMPILLHAEIIRNILYSGVWTKYEYLQLKKKAKSEKRSTDR